MISRANSYLSLVLMLSWVNTLAQDTRFFKIAGPAATSAVSLLADGSLVWSNAQANAIYSIKTATTISPGTIWVDYIQIAVTQAINTNLLFDFSPPQGMVFVPEGVFSMGNSTPADEDLTDAAPVSVFVSAFYLDANLVRYDLWNSVFSFATNHGYLFTHAGSGKAADQPVHTINWYDAVAWCNARSQQMGLTPVYRSDAQLSEVYINSNTTNVYASWKANGFRLPTEAEWEKAARGGLIGKRFPWGDSISGDLANYYGAKDMYSYDLGPNGFNAIGKRGSVSPYTSPVGSFAPNGYGVLDMAGNIQQWCWDWYSDLYAGGNDPHGPGSSPTGVRVVRGGTWSQFASLCRCANRTQVVPTNADFNAGFRCARAVVPQIPL